MTAIRFETVTKRFGTTVAVDRVTLEIADGELFFLLGPSGCGKTTLLRILAGFAQPDEGDVFFGPDRVTRLLDEWAVALRLTADERQAWHDAGRWHDALRDAPAERLRALAGDPAMPERVLHGHERELRVRRAPVPVPGFDVIAVWHPRVHADPAHQWFRMRLAATASRMRPS